jgi:nucleoside-diphosphate-sugar epimerase
MKILHIGGTGFLGSHIVNKLITRNNQVTIITRNPDKEMPSDKSKVSFIEVAGENWPIARQGIAVLGKCYDQMISEIKSDNSIPLSEMLPAQIYGNGGMFDKMIAMAKKGRIVILGGGKNYLPRIHVDDCAEAFVLAIEKLPLGKRFIVSDDENVIVKDLMSQLAEIFGAKKVLKIPKPLLRIGIQIQKFQIHSLRKTWADSPSLQPIEKD